MSRIVVKVGSSSLSTAGGGLDGDRVDALVDALAAARARGDEIVLVSSGAIAAGLAPLGLARRPRDLATQQAAASVGQGALIARYAERFSGHGLVVGQVLLTADDMVRRTHYGNAQRALHRLLELGNPGAVDGRQISQLVGDLLQLLSLTAQVYGFAGILHASGRRQAVGTVLG